MQSPEKLRPLALLLLRVALGAIFLYHGYPKLFGHTREALQWFAQHGFPSFFAYIAGIVECFGGCLLIAGLFTRVAGLLLAGEVAIALWKVHGILANPWKVPNYELPLALAVGAFALAVLGGGPVALDRLFFPEGKRSPRKPKNKD